MQSSFKRQMQVCEVFLNSKSIKGNMRRCSNECTCFCHPGLSELEGSGSQLTYIFPQHCLQLNRQTQVAVLGLKLGKETEMMQKKKDTLG